MGSATAGNAVVCVLIVTSSDCSQPENARCSDAAADFLLAIAIEAVLAINMWVIMKGGLSIFLS